MSKLTYLTHAQIAFPDEIVEDGALVLEGEVIRDIRPPAQPAGAVEVDLEGALLTPGLIDLHSDAVESLAEPRPGGYLPFAHAAEQIDRLAAACGITTFYNAISFAGEELGLRNQRAGCELVDALHEQSRRALVDLRVHCRFEVTFGQGLIDILSFLDRGACHFVSYMDHSPGQGQFRDVAVYREYMTTRYGYGDEEINQLLEEKHRAAADIDADVRRLADRARALGVPLAGHDPDSAAQVDEMRELGAVLAEFPMNLEAARAGVDAGLHQSVGATNVIRGGSQRSGLSALDVIGEGLADCLCSDYCPSVMLPAAFKVADVLGKPLHEALHLVTRNPARAAGLRDRGEIAVGRRADLVACRLLDGGPQVECVWSGGQPILATRSGYLSRNV